MAYFQRRWNGKKSYSRHHLLRRQLVLCPNTRKHLQAWKILRNFLSDFYNRLFYLLPLVIEGEGEEKQDLIAYNTRNILEFFLAIQCIYIIHAYCTYRLYALSVTYVADSYGVTSRLRYFSNKDLRNARNSSNR